jgi:protein-S-isoprenylcysteine O-methyltransferase Ste14
VRPPLVYVASLAIGTLLQFAMPLPFPTAPLLGACLIVVALALLSYSIAEFHAAGTPVPARKPTKAIVRTGPYRISRNPIYLAYSLLQLGIAVWANSLWLLATLIGAVSVIDVFVIPKEERYLQHKFGGEYLDYKSTVRRWL